MKGNGLAIMIALAVIVCTVCLADAPGYASPTVSVGTGSGIIVAQENAATPAQEADSQPTPSGDSSQPSASATAAGEAAAETETPGLGGNSLSAFLEEQQNAHDKFIVDRFLLGVAVIFAVIAFLLFKSLPPKQREQKG